MGTDWPDFTLFAQGDAGQGAVKVEPGAEPTINAEQPPFWIYVVPLALTFGIFYFLFILPEKKKAQEKEDLLGNLKKNDKVVTIGGVYGVVASVNKDGEDVLIKIDEDKDVKMRVTKTSIARVITGKDETKDADKTA
ncbi:preprotein translocase subunit YajC [Planctomycetes bacterium Pan216]|uniref:Sec translocon accessory complex subunit YajC n=1 Tax=Kolteria novifilia TaxID=2527975 RepID=A0A518BAZ8_9BACT|nr:preprotein translocase subunit YajC [Planctomycetes bacterium Pan216]